MAISSNNGNFYILKMEGDSVQVKQTLEFHKNVQENMGLYLVEEDKVMIVMGGLDKLVHLY